MDIEKIIEELRAERERVTEIILAIERLQHDDAAPAVKRRGRKFMDKKGRKEVSARMKRYWAARRKEKGAKTAAAGSGDSGETGMSELESMADSHRAAA